MKPNIYLLFISLLLFIYVIIPIKCTSRKDDSVPESSIKPDPGPSTSSLNPLAKEFKPNKDHLSHYKSHLSADELYFQQFLPQNITPTGSCDFDKYFPTFTQNHEEIGFPVYDESHLWNFSNQSEDPLNQPEKQFITDSNPEWIIYNISKHFDEFGWPEEEKFLTEDKYLMGINFLSEKANWILEILSHKDEITKDKLTKKYQKFGHYDDRRMLKTLELLDRYASCVAQWNKKNIITITGPISVHSDVSEKIEKGRIVKSYPFNKEVKHPPINQVFKVVIIEYESKKYCADIIFTNANWNEDTKFEEISKENCGKDHLNSNWDYKNYIKDYKIMGELFKDRLEFLEWYIGFELIDLLHNSGFVKIESIDICDNSKLFKETEPTSKNKFKKYKNELDLPTFTKKFKNIKLSDITEANREKYRKSNIRIYQDFIINFNRRKRIPNWVLECLTKESMNNLTAGRHGIWSPDPDFSEIFQPKYADYECHPNSIHNHGHLATGNLHPHEQGFYLTNSVPQYNEVNSGHWRVIEEYISCMAKEAEVTFIYTGPLFLPNQKKNLMEFQVIYWALS
uniref:Extracellular Endonuclease subunit A domain-containing protein n=1 Tax=Meloidogyne incognita TaxID=6306 RepID=A0A914N7J3_MELIC